MKSRRFLQFLLTFLLFFFYACNANPVETREETTKFDEMLDMNKVEKNAEEIENPSTPLFFPTPNASRAINLNSASNLKYDVEVLESEDLKKDNFGYEERFRGAALHLDTNIFSDEDIEVHKIKEPRPISYFALMSIFTIFGLIVLIIYAVLMTWRHKLEQRYGQRVLLVSNCDDYDDYMRQMHSGESSTSGRPYPWTTP